MVTPKKSVTAVDGPVEALPELVIPTANCVNCGQPAVWETRNPGAETAYYCDACASQTYPGEMDWYLEKLNA